jgi:NTP pyrophosphatase (non-canonical NTP hydrolase)
MDFNSYQQLASRTECDQTRSLARMANLLFSRTKDLEPSQLRQIRLNHGVLGLTGEVGELAAALERWVYYGQDLDAGNVAEEVGDCLWYLSLVCDSLGLSLEDCAAANIRKLKARYPEAYSDERAGVRDLEAERKALGALGYPKTASTLYGPADWLCDCGHINLPTDTGCAKCGNQSSQANLKAQIAERQSKLAEQVEKEALTEGGSLTHGVAEKASQSSGHPANCNYTPCRQRRLHPEHFKSDNRPPDQPNPFGCDESENT